MFILFYLTKFINDCHILCRWVTARAKRLPNPWESDGRINLGLFEGEKRLNVKYGWREYPVHGKFLKFCLVLTLLQKLYFVYSILVTELVHNEREFLLYGAWIATIGCLAVGLLFSTLSAVFAVLNTATNQYLTLTGIPGLYMWNLLASK